VVDVAQFEDDCVSACVVDESLRILISTPLTSKERPVGALALGCRHRDRLTTQEVEMLTAIGQQVGMAVDNARLHHETERWAEELALLHESSVILTATLDPATIYRQLAEQAAKLLGCQVATIFRWDEEAQQAVGVYSYGLDGSGIKDLPVQADEGVLFQELVDRHGSIAIEDARADARIPPLWRAQFKIQALLCLPLLGKDRTLAFLCLVDQTGPRRWHANEVAWAESFVNNAAMALENAYLYEQAERAATLEERQRIAADMHDGLAQTLSYLGLKAYHATELLEEGRTQEVLDHHADIQTAIERASTEVRQSISSLQESPPPRRPLQVWLAEIVGAYAKNGGPAAELVSEVAEPLFVPSKQIEQVSRVVQEALHNAGRHARAQRIVVRLEKIWDEIRVTVEDDGQGFDLTSPPQDGRDHFGLSIMRARAARIGARLKIDTAPGQGTRVSLTWSLQDRAVNPLPGMTRLVAEGLIPRRQIVSAKE